MRYIMLKSNLYFNLEISLRVHNLSKILKSLYLRYLLISCINFNAYDGPNGSFINIQHLLNS